jgi:hypothetical protein
MFIHTVWLPQPHACAFDMKFLSLLPRCRDTSTQPVVNISYSPITQGTVSLIYEEELPETSKALLWPSARDFRVVVKATGHTYQGRCIGSGGLRIWTHHMRGIDYILSFQSPSWPDEEAWTALRVAVNHANIEIQEEVAKHDMEWRW